MTALDFETDFDFATDAGCHWYWIDFPRTMWEDNPMHATAQAEVEARMNLPVTKWVPKRWKLDLHRAVVFTAPDDDTWTMVRLWGLARPPGMFAVDVTP